MPDRVTVFIDGQNAYNCARAAFFPLVRARHFTDGQFDPMALGAWLASRDTRGFERELRAREARLIKWLAGAAGVAIAVNQVLGAGVGG